MIMINEKYAKTFLDNQDKLFDEPVAETIDEAIEFLEDVMAIVVDNVDELRDYFEGCGVDTEDMSDDELLDSLEVFKMDDGKLLIVEG
ncbi:MAG: glyoxalase [Lachnospiraceae bacterium]|nr:glyoxalase [Lachnospiraceae bacterium]